MATATISFNARNSLAASLFQAIKLSGVFTVQEDSKPLYNPNFVQKIKSQEGKNGTAIKIQDLWN